MAIAGNKARRTLMRSVLLYAALLAVFGFVTALVIRDVANGDRGSIIALAVLLLFVALEVFLITQAVLDLRSAPMTTEGPILRKWRAGMVLLLFVRRPYLLVGKRVFQVEQQAFEQVDEGDVINVTHYPRTNVVVMAELVSRGPESKRSL